MSAGRDASRQHKQSLVPPGIDAILSTVVKGLTKVLRVYTVRQRQQQQQQQSRCIVRISRRRMPGNSGGSRHLCLRWPGKPRTVTFRHRRATSHADGVTPTAGLSRVSITDTPTTPFGAALSPRPCLHQGDGLFPRPSTVPFPRASHALPFRGSRWVPWRSTPGSGAIGVSGTPTCEQ